MSFEFILKHKPENSYYKNETMQKKYIIDGNNLIGKISELWKLQQKEKQLSRVKLARKLDQYFSDKKVEVSLHFDGFQGDAIPTAKLRIYYSNNSLADSKIKKEIDNSKNPKLITVVSSDYSVMQYAKVSSCTVIKSEEFAKELKKTKKQNSEEEILKTIDNDEIKK
ncbi:MAG: hypothetical protein CR986_09980, partial [Ignavibacteriae bacterium]